MKRTIILLFAAFSLNTFAQNLGKGIAYSAELSSTVSDGAFAPFWLTSNKYGLSSVENCSGYIRGGVFRSLETDSLKKWKVGYGADMVVPINYTSKFIIQQLYGELEYKKGRLTIGAKEYPLEMKNAELSSGDLTYSTNSRPVPQVRLELNDFWDIPGTRKWFGFKGHIAYGVFTDSKWQKDNNAGTLNVYTKGAKYHSKSGYVRVGNEEVFPLTLVGGVHFCAQFGGEAWNVGKRIDDTSDFNGEHVTMNNGFNSYLRAFFPGGSDASDGAYANAEGNQLGSYQASLTYKGKGWSVKGYAEHFFEDHSMMFFQYEWKDFLWGLECNLPRNPFVSTFVYEFLNTKQQTGAIYHDHTESIPEQISGADNYYNHNIYGSWQHWGQAIGNPLLLSPIYNNDGSLLFRNNRITAHHIGISGDPCSELHYRFLYSHVKSLGTYSEPHTDPKTANYFMAEATYSPRKINGLSVTLAYGLNGGNLIGSSNGGMITISKKGVITK